MTREFDPAEWAGLMRHLVYTHYWYLIRFRYYTFEEVYWAAMMTAHVQAAGWSPELGVSRAGFVYRRVRWKLRRELNDYRPWFYHVARTYHGRAGPPRVVRFSDLTPGDRCLLRGEGAVDDSLAAVADLDDVAHWLRRLPDPKHRLLVRLWLGLDGNGRRTLAEMAAAVGLTRERVRQIIVKACYRCGIPTSAKNIARRSRPPVNQAAALSKQFRARGWSLHARNEFIRNTLGLSNPTPVGRLDPDQVRTVSAALASLAGGHAYDPPDRNPRPPGP